VGRNALGIGRSAVFLISVKGSGVGMGAGLWVEQPDNINIARKEAVARMGISLKCVLT